MQDNGSTIIIIFGRADNAQKEIQHSQIQKNKNIHPFSSGDSHTKNIDNVDNIIQTQNGHNSKQNNKQ